MASSSSPKMILICSGGKALEVDDALVNASETLKSLKEKKNVGGYNFPDISIETMSKINEYAKKHAEAEEHKKTLDAWDEEFIKVGQDILYHLIMASFKLKIENLMNLGAKRAADMIRGKSPEQIRQMLNIKNDFTPEEEAEIREENEWAFKP